MLPGMKWRIAFAVIALLMTGFATSAKDASTLSPDDLKKILGFVDTIGAKQIFPAPMAENLGLSKDAKQDLPVVSIVTDNHQIYFCRSSLDASDYIIWVIGSDKKSSSMFVTHEDLKLVRALYMRDEAMPQLQNVGDPKVIADYEKALAGLASDLHKTKNR
ncbi:MAG: hypothetical protein KGK33_17945 [Hyphomicrobiales bacterium]|nr:hypothetical protein [Hyphomicrobiales bacterium]